MTQGADTEDEDEARVGGFAAHRRRARWIGRCILPHEADLRRMLERRAPTGLEVDDIIQEIYARLAAMASIDHIHSPRSYVFRMASGVMTDYLRHQKVVPIHRVDDIDAAGRASEEPSPEEVVVHRDQLGRVVRIIGQLPPRVRDVFKLRRIEGLSQREVSRQLGVPESTIEKRMARGVFLIAQQWETGGSHQAEPKKTGVGRSRS